MEGQCAITFFLTGATEDEIRAAALDLKRSFNGAAAKRYSGYRPGIFTIGVRGAPDEPERSAGEDGDPERLFD